MPCSLPRILTLAASSVSALLPAMLHFPQVLPPSSLGWQHLVATAHQALYASILFRSCNSNRHRPLSTLPVKHRLKPWVLANSFCYTLPMNSPQSWAARAPEA